MTQIVLTLEQFQVVCDVDKPVQVLAPDGSQVGVLTRNRSVASLFTPAEFAEIQQRLADGGPRYTTEQVLAHLDSLASR